MHQTQYHRDARNRMRYKLACLNQLAAVIGVEAHLLASHVHQLRTAHHGKDYAQAIERDTRNHTDTGDTTR